MLPWAGAVNQARSNGPGETRVLPEGRSRIRVDVWAVPAFCCAGCERTRPAGRSLAFLAGGFRLLRSTSRPAYRALKQYGKEPDLMPKNGSVRLLSIN